MPTKLKRNAKLWLILIAVLFWLAGSGFYRDLSASGDETYKGLKIFSDVIELIEKNYVDEVDSKETILKAIHGMVNSLDPHSSFLPPEALEELHMDTEGEFGGIGIVITMKNGLITVISPIVGTPAYKAGIMAGDKIIEVDGQPTKDMMLWEAVRKMRGVKGTPVELTIIRPRGDKPIHFKLIRDIIPLESVKSLVLKPGIGYVWITNFRGSTVQDLDRALTGLETATVPLIGLILDLRDNPGGLLNQAVQISDLFLEKGTIVSIKGRLKRHTKVFKAQPDTTKRTYPMVVLINGGSASASEIVAGALQDNKRALILGTTSFGKGSVQTVETLRGGYGLKLTIARYYTPSGKSIQAQGILPDIEVVQKPIEDAQTAAKPVGVLKEKDLKNHLEAEPKTDEKESTDVKTPTEKKKPSPIRRMESKHVPLEVERLQSDYQVMRALEILVSHQILKRDES